MPAEYSRFEVGKRERAMRRVGYSVELKQIDQELKRSRGELACAECNRLKVKCDKKVPCSSCVRRGVSDLCPKNALADVRDTREPVTDTERLKVKVMEMSERIRQLEDALEIATANMPARHPLLRDELLAIKRGFGGLETGNVSAKQEDVLTDDFGTLTISDDGSSRFMGRTGGSESQMMADLLAEPDVLISSDFSFASPTIMSQDLIDPGDIRRVEGAMPSFERATTLCETYLQQASWFFQLVRRPQLIDELLVPIYQRIESDAPTNIDDDVKYRHSLALLLSVFALGALQDLTLPPYNDEAHTFYLLAHSLINMESAADCPSLTVVQALGTMCSYFMLSGSIHSMDRTRTMLGYVSVLAAAIGLHRDPARWKLDEKAVQRRREVFWQLFMVTNWQGLKSGRPLVFTLPFIETELPNDCEQVFASDGSVQAGGWQWSYMFTKEILSEINAMSSRVGSVKYSDVMELDSKIRDFGVPQHLQARPTESSWENDGPYVTMQRFLAISCYNTTFIELHRNFFAKALLDCPNDPLSGQYAASFLSTYRASIAVLRNLREHFNLCPDLLVRNIIPWIHVFSALVVLGAVVIRGPTSSLTPAAMIELTLGVAVFEKAAEANAQWAKRALTVLVGIREKALATYTWHRNGQPIMDKSVTKGSTRSYWVAETDLYCRPSSSTKYSSGNQSGSVTHLSPSPPLSEEAFQPQGLKLSEQLTNPPRPVDKSNPQSPIPDGVSEQDLAAFLAAVSNVYPATVPFSSSPAGQTSIPEQPETFLPPQAHHGPSDPFGSTIAADGAYSSHDMESVSTMAFEMDAYGIPTMDAFGMSSMDIAMDESWSTFLQDSGFMLNPAEALGPLSFT
ncbi:hypothetical protein BD410DRAFT_900945 [Rickenella mellea]|uniref:Zn(2)-C6 fungal-type domain-containing protein n=1 Tax=Rickenella mellea TaxID=50990 RepID=A0A4Y7PSV9_9AGAM|nr:hypothetical protein BD410DRAFT_900945 [Rickenella mellea]